MSLEQVSLGRWFIGRILNLRPINSILSLRFIRNSLSCLSKLSGNKGVREPQFSILNSQFSILNSQFPLSL
jgi:hypothetical protein